MYGPININTIRAEDYRRSQLPTPALKSHREAAALQRLVESGAERRKGGWFIDNVFLGSDVFTAVEAIVG